MAAGATYEPIATQTLASAAASITFSSIAASWTDLRLVMVAKEDTTSRNYANLRFNGDTGTNYSRTYIFGNGTTANSGVTTSAAQIRWDINGLYDTLPSMMTADIFSYAGSTYKTCLLTCAEDYNGAGNTDAQVGLWRSTAAITSITIVNVASNLAIGTIATLYGIKAA